jgi:hypothetical protein
MRGRCNNPQNPAYPYYGGRGIYVVAEWETFKQFYADMGPRPSAKHSLDRIDNDGPYSPENCRWATWTEQMNNTRLTRRIEFQGQCLSVSEWSRELGVPVNTLLMRLHRGWSPIRTLSEPLRKWPAKDEEAARLTRPEKAPPA